MKIEDVEKEIGISLDEIKEKLEIGGFKKKRRGDVITEEEYRYLKGLNEKISTSKNDHESLTQTKSSRDNFIFETISVKEDLWNDELFFKPIVENKNEDTSESEYQGVEDLVLNKEDDNNISSEDSSEDIKRIDANAKNAVGVSITKTKEDAMVKNKNITDSIKTLQKNNQTSNPYRLNQININKKLENSSVNKQSLTNIKTNNKAKDEHDVSIVYGDDKKDNTRRDKPSFKVYRRKTNTESLKKLRLLKKEKNKSKKLKVTTEDDRKIVVTNKVSLKDLAGILKCDVENLMSICNDLDIPIATQYQTLERNVILLLAGEYNYDVSFPETCEEHETSKDIVENKRTRKPIVTVVGHVDHGKTTLVDYICKSSVAKSEEGGITQNINAYNIITERGEEFTLIDTPGHKIFSEMRARAISIADIAIVIIAADSGIQDQTKEILKQITFLGKPVVFAFNKIDKEGVNIDKIKEMLANLNFIVEDWGGKYQCQEISAQRGIGVNDLLEKVMLEAAMLDLEVDYNCQAKGIILDSLLEKANGYQNKILIKEGTLKEYDFIVAGTLYGKIRQIKNGNKIVKEALPSESVMITGISGCAQPGESFTVITSEHEAREMARRYQQILREQNVNAQQKMTFDMMKKKMLEGKKKEIGIIINACTKDIGRVISEHLSNFSSDKYSINIVKENVGEILTSDVDAAVFSKAIIIGFNVNISATTMTYAEKNKIMVKSYKVIYDLLDHIDEIVAEYDSQNKELINVGKAEVLQIFKIKKTGTIAGCVIREGTAHIKDIVNVNRKGRIIFSGNIKSMRHGPVDITEAKIDSECGVCINRYDDIKKGDILEFMQRQ